MRRRDPDERGRPHRLLPLDWRRMATQAYRQGAKLYWDRRGETIVDVAPGRGSAV